MDKINEIQAKILCSLLFNPKARFKDLNIDQLTTDNFSYHIKSLLNLELIKKENNFYCLTNKGKMVAGKMDTTTNTVEKQPKVSVIIVPHQIIKGEEKFLIQQRTKEPYFGYWGFISGKIKFGETLEESVLRELGEESGITGKTKFCYEIHEMVYDKNTNEQLEDKFFHVVEVTDIKGEIKDTQEGRNKMMTVAEFRKIVPKYHNEDDLMTWFLNKDFKFKEEKYYIEKF
ncbi:MAG: NUDIX hydrolase [Candidatus Shapirobacteria bacterium]|jgi:8-oxo-dGTP pyrophosphatase MutT (NUDIX family)